MTAFHSVDNQLYVEEVSVAEIAAVVGTPFYAYSTAVMTGRLRAFQEAFAGRDVMICYAMKANGNLAVLRTLARLGAGADVVSGGELARALAAGIPPERIVFSGVGKSRSELLAALTAGIWQINVESEPELRALSALADELGVTAPVSLRVNPDVDAKTHAKISTGRKENKFGIDIEQAPEIYALANRLPGVRPLGIAVHIGSQLADLAPFRAAFAAVTELVIALRRRGLTVERVDLGGGLGIPYRAEPLPAIAAYAAMVRDVTATLDCRIVIEPGRSLIGEAGILVSRVLYVKEGRNRRFLILDAAMNDLIRPALYEAYHALVPVKTPEPGVALRSYDVVGPVCETGDTFALERPLPPLVAGDLVALTHAGAYGAAMASEYNARPLIPEVLVRGRGFAVVRRRPTLEERLALEQIPDWLGVDR